MTPQESRLLPSTPTISIMLPKSQGLSAPNALGLSTLLLLRATHILALLGKVGPQS